MRREATESEHNQADAQLDASELAALIELFLLLDKWERESNNEAMR
jgi:hypothetical protein